MKLFKFFKNFLRCGLTGWCLEILFTAANSLRRREMTLQGTTSLWMFPIYGLGALIGPFSYFLRNRTIAFRGAVYTFFIFSVEFVSGRFLSRHKLCPWNYRRAGWNIRELIRLDYAPFWFLTGLLFERLVQPPSHETSVS